MVSSVLGSKSHQSNRLFWVMFVALMLGAATMRLWNLEDFPKFIHNDESAMAVYTSPPFSKPSPDSPLWGFTEYGGHCNLGPWLTALPGIITGRHTLYTTRLASAISGTLSILIFGLFTAVVYGRRAALLCLAFLVPFHLHMQYSRTGFFFAHALPAFAAVAFALSQFALKPSALRAFVLGITLGFSVMTYSATHVLPGAVIPAMLAVFFSKTFRDLHPSGRLSHAVKVFGSFVFGALLITTKEILYLMQHGNYNWRPRSQFLLNTDVLANRRQQLGPDSTVFDVIWASFLKTLNFFYEGDGAVQYGCFEGLLPFVLVIPAAIGCLVLLFRLFKGEPNTVYIVILAFLTVLGSALLVEASFSPHLIVFSLLCPLALALGIDLILRVTRLGSLPIVSLVVLLGSVAWIPWNLAYLKEVDRRKQTPESDIVHLNIDRDSVRSILNLSSKNEDFPGSTYILRYPNAKKLRFESSTPPQQIPELLTNSTCPCLLLVDAPAASSFDQAVQSTGRPFETLPSKIETRSYFLVR